MENLYLINRYPFPLWIEFMENRNSEEPRLCRLQKGCSYFLPPHEVVVLSLGFMAFLLTQTCGSWVCFTVFILVELIRLSMLANLLKQTHLDGFTHTLGSVCQTFILITCKDKVKTTLTITAMQTWSPGVFSDSWTTSQLNVNSPSRLITFN